VAQRLHGMPAEDVFVEDALGTFAIDAGVPDVLWIDNDHWTVPALVHAACVIDANDSLQPMLRRSLFQHFMHIL